MSRFRRAAVVTAATALLGVSLAPSVSAEPTEPSDPIIFPAGTACEFELQVDIGAGNRDPKEFLDEAGNTIRVITAGLGTALTFTNLDSDETVSFKANGAVNKTTFNSDGSTRTVLTGHNVLIMFPTDNPAGPTTTLYVGRVVITNDANIVTTVQSESGRKTDICAALS